MAIEKSGGKIVGLRGLGVKRKRKSSSKKGHSHHAGQRKNTLKSKSYGKYASKSSDSPTKKGNQSISNNVAAKPGTAASIGKKPELPIKKKPQLPLKKKP
tara:strand:- start:381 stop:680 length:300 start_codon:yes stop_codon:yes gene_type:complete